MQNFKKLSLSIAFTALSMIGSPAYAQTDEPFEQWLAKFQSEAVSKGISPEMADAALTGLQPIQRVIDLDKKQPESKMTFDEYRQRIVNQTRIEKGREMLRQHGDLLREVGKKFGVPPQYIVALWGIETNYGQNTGGFEIVPALATLAWEGRRADFFRGELLTALKILDEKHIPLADMKGSWAGAMGQCQFMPSSFNSFAVDYNQDGRKDIWGTLSDVFASTANYLSTSGWKEDQRWGREVSLPKGFDAGLVGLNTRKSLAEWKNLGVKLPGGGSIPVVAGMQASLVAPDGVTGATYLVYDNYRTIMKWNRSTYFATSVGLLANAISP